MLSLDEWLLRVGFSGGNPFALRWADDERDRLQEYFVEHGAYHALLDAGQPRSAVLYARRGAGKSTTRLMFAAACAAAPAPPLVVQLTDWMPLAEAAAAGPLGPRELLCELLRLYVAALADAAPPPAAVIPAEAAAPLRWVCQQHGDYLLPGQRAALAAAGWLGGAPEPHGLDGLPVLRALELLARLTRAVGRPHCYVLVDGVDELCATAASWEAAAAMLAPLLGNIRLLEVPGLAFKCFVPTEVLLVLRERGQLREDRVVCAELTWERGPLADLLRGRLLAYSDGQVESLAMCAEPDAGDVDDALCRAADSPRRLLALADELIRAAAREASDERLLIRGAQLARLLTPAPAAQPAPPAPAAPPPAALAPLRLAADGTLWRGEAQIEAARRLSPLQRRLLEYLYEHSGTICSTDQLIDVTWSDRERPNDRDSLRRLVERLVEIIEPDPKAPAYLERIYGGYYVLRNTAR
jgi:DNA-binding response OmpR family regulator